MQPTEFIPVAEETGQIVELGRWILREACHQASGWTSSGEGVAAPFVTVNVSVLQLADSAFVADVAIILAESGLAPERLVLELTESMLFSDSDSTDRLLMVKRLGVRVALDDFGTGYSSLSYLRRVPVDVIKVARELIDVGDDEGQWALVRAVVAMSSRWASASWRRESSDLSNSIGSSRWAASSARVTCFLGRSTPPRLADSSRHHQRRSLFLILTTT